MEFIPLPEDYNGPAVEQRLPTSGRIHNYTGKKVDSYTIVGFVGFIDQYPSWRLKCNGCGYDFVVRSNADVLKKQPSVCDHRHDLRQHPAYQLATTFYNQNKSKLENRYPTARSFLIETLPTYQEGCVLLLTSDNAQWVQPEIRRRINRPGSIRYQGQHFTYQEIADKLGISKQAIKQRLDKVKAGLMTLDDAITLKNMQGKGRRTYRETAPRRLCPTRGCNKVFRSNVRNTCLKCAKAKAKNLLFTMMNTKRITIDDTKHIAAHVGISNPTVLCIFEELKN